jgi:carbohydrate kinase (thermoresistant glucokinase family)
VIAVIMGVSGSGKTAIGEALARELGWRFLDADDYHPPANIAKMAAGQALDDDDRTPWLEKLNQELWKFDASDESVVLACSALKERYRRRLSEGIHRIEWVYLKGDFDLIHSRLAQRRHRYMPASLLQSQFAALEPPQRAIAVDVSADIAACVAAIAAQLKPG